MIKHLDAIMERSTTAKVLLSALERRAQGKPSQQNVTPEQLLAKVRLVLDDIAQLLKE